MISTNCYISEWKWEIKVTCASEYVVIWDEKNNRAYNIFDDNNSRTMVSLRGVIYEISMAYNTRYLGVPYEWRLSL